MLQVVLEQVVPLDHRVFLVLLGHRAFKVLREMLVVLVPRTSPNKIKTTFELRVLGIFMRIIFLRRARI